MSECILQEKSFSTAGVKGSYRVVKGCGDIFIARRGFNIGSVLEEKSIYLCSAEEGSIIPAYSYQNSSHINWYFILHQGEEAQIELLKTELTEDEQLLFLEKTPAAPFIEDQSINSDNRFNECLMSWYDMEEIRQLSQFEPEVEGEFITVDSSSELYTKSADGMLMVELGKVNVFVGNSYSGVKHKLFCMVTLNEGESFPAFGFRDAGGTKWYYKIAAVGATATLKQLGREASEEEITSFLVRAGIQNQDTIAGYNETVMEWYNTKRIKPILIPDSGPGRDCLPETTLGKHFVQGDLPIFRAVSYACYRCNIAHHTEETVQMYCGEAPVTVEKIAECSHFIFRKVILEDGWWKNDCGPIIGMIGGDPVACVPIGGAKYEIFYASNPDVKEAVRLTPEIAQTIHPSACSIGRTLPGKKLSKRELLNFASKSIVKLDVIWIAALGLAAALIGVLLPTMNQLIYDNYIPLGDTPQLLQLGVVIATFMIGNLFFGIVKNLSEYRVSSRVGYDLQNATMYRSFFLPERFFRNYDSADLAQRILQIDEITDAYSNFFLISGLSFIFSLVYLIKMFKYSAKLSWAALGMIAVFTALLLLISISASKKQKKLVQANGEASARLYQYICAIDKIRMAGAEERAAQKYIDPVREKEIAEIEKEKLISLKNTLRGAAVTIFSMVLYYVIIHKKLGVSIGNFTGFNAAFGSFAAAILALVDSYTSIYQTRPSLERLMPIYETDTEYESEADKQKSKRQLPSLHGSFKLENVHFSYTADGPEVLKGINMEIAPGDYVGIVGKSGCGKSTLLKLLLGFEAPSHGAIMVDKINMNELDKKTYRKKLGVVLQNGSLIEGSIQENITITATGAKVEDVRRVIKAVGLEEDIKNMPMGINTMLNENTGTISGGQKQRILIARALIGKPTAILLDEATSALDNITQKEVCNTLDGISATKIVIAHRLSTIQNCNKIYVLEAGRVAEEGSYQELMKKKGLFYEMAQRQLPGEEDKDG